MIGQAETLDRADRVVLDMDSSESPVHGQQEGSAYNGHFETVCYHPLFLLSVLAYNLGNLWRRLVLSKRIDSWSLTSLQQRLVNTGGRLVKHAICRCRHSMPATTGSCWPRVI